ncbi:hypothetical protein TNCV_3890771 [Trichonephila clavipes]|nr:hypothetical protein TNCV_3890771 [Trichonephila clavipes]
MRLSKAVVKFRLVRKRFVIKKPLICIVDALLSWKLLQEPKKISVPLGSRSLVLEWYEGNHRGAALLGSGSRRDETALARFRSAHTRAKRHVAGLKFYSSSPNCNVTQDASAHILACIGCHKSQLLSSPAAVLQCLKTYGSLT